MTAKKGWEATAPWIGVDMDGTLAKYPAGRGLPWNAFGPPIPAMVDRIKYWLSRDKEVRIVTARVFPYVFGNPSFSHAISHRHQCLVTGLTFTCREMIEAIGDYTELHVGQRLPSTCAKDYQMIELWDDRAVQVVPNTGRTLAEEHEAVVSALKGRAFKAAE
jgi:hypothetical protein